MKPFSSSDYVPEHLTMKGSRWSPLCTLISMNNSLFIKFKRCIKFPFLYCLFLSTDIVCLLIFPMAPNTISEISVTSFKLLVRLFSLLVLYFINFYQFINATIPSGIDSSLNFTPKILFIKG